MNYKPFDDQNKIILLINIDEYQVENKLIENAIEDEFLFFSFYWILICQCNPS